MVSVKTGKDKNSPLVIVAFVALMHIVVSEFALINGWSPDRRFLLAMAGFVCDLIFFSEFAVRSFFFGRKKMFAGYLLKEGGDIDFLCSFPLLLLDSIPSLLCFAENELLFPGAITRETFCVLMTINSVKILRLFRIAKMANLLGNFKSAMAAYHSRVIVFSIVISITLVGAVFSAPLFDPSLRNISQRVAHYTTLVECSPENISEWLLKNDPLVLQAKKDSVVLVDTFAGGGTAAKVSSDFRMIQTASYGLIISVADIHAHSALYRMLLAFIAIVVCAVIELRYSGHFDAVITDVLTVMRKGLFCREYNLMVKIPQEYKDHEIYTIARLYNEKFLPEKMRNLAKEPVADNQSLMEYLEKFDRE